MYCKNCGSTIDDRAVVCPNCGVATDNKIARAEPSTNVLAIVGFVLSFLVTIAGLICCVIARKQIRESDEKGMGFATAGMIISIVGIALSVLLVIIYIGIIGAAVSAGI